MKKLIYTLIVLFSLTSVVGAAVYYSGGKDVKGPISVYFVEGNDAKDAEILYSSTNKLQYLAPCLTASSDVMQGYYNCVCKKNDKNAIAILKQDNEILNKHQAWLTKGTINYRYGEHTRAINLNAYKRIVDAVKPCLK